MLYSRFLACRKFKNLSGHPYCSNPAFCGTQCIDSPINSDYRLVGKDKVKKSRKRDERHETDNLKNEFDFLLILLLFACTDDLFKSAIMGSYTIMVAAQVSEGS